MFAELVIFVAGMASTFCWICSLWYVGLLFALLSTESVTSIYMYVLMFGFSGIEKIVDGKKLQHSKCAVLNTGMRQI